MILQFISMIRRGFTLLLTTLPIILILSILIGETNTADAQYRNVIWDFPINLSNSIGGSTRPTIVADPWGQVHVFWSEKIGGKSTPEGQAPEEGNSIYYSRWIGTYWSEPIDIFFSFQGEPFKDPAVTIDSKGTINLVWVGTSNIYYRQSSALAPVSAKAWQPTQTLANALGVGQAEIATGPTDQLYVVYDAVLGNGLINYLQSVDGGLNWSDPYSISQLHSPAAGFDTRPRIEVDTKGRLHVNWQEQTLPPEFKGLGLYYSRSEDEGITWSQQVNLSEGLDFPNEHVWGPGFIVATDEENLLIIYIAGDAPRRYYRYSQDGGQNWSPPTKLFGDLLSQAGWDAVAVDGDGIAHAIMQLRYPVALYSSNWSTDNWIDPPNQLIASGALADAHYPQMVISEGNQIHVVMEEHPEGEIWYMHGMSQSPYKPPEPLASLQTNPTVQPKIIPTPIPNNPLNKEEQVSEMESEITNTVSYQPSTTLPTLIAVLATVIVFGAAILLRKFLSN